MAKPAIFAGMFRLLLCAAIFMMYPACQPDKPDPASPSGTESGSGNFEGLVDDYESKERDGWQKPDVILKALGDLTGKTVVDLGAGSGYFSFRLLPRAGRVIALEIDTRFIDYLEKKARRLPDSLRSRLDIRLATPADPHLHEGEADVVLVVNTYIYMQDRVAYFRQLRTRMKPGGQLMVVDFHKKPLRLGPPLEVKLAAHTVTGELIAAGYEEVTADHHTLPFQYLITARRPVAIEVSVR